MNLNDLKIRTYKCCTGTRVTIDSNNEFVSLKKQIGFVETEIWRKKSYWVKVKNFLPLIASKVDFWRGRFILKTWIDSNLQSEAAYKGYQMTPILLLLIGQPIITGSLVDNWPIEIQRHPTLFELNLYIFPAMSLKSFRLW